jgi:hypothetical protein
VWLNYRHARPRVIRLAGFDRERVRR